MSDCNGTCGKAPVILYACSGASDVGGLADQAARKLSREGCGKMSCLAGIGGRVSGLMASAESASGLVAIDGCPQNCAKKILELAGFNQFTHIQLADLGLIKTQSPVNDENINKVVSYTQDMMSKTS